MVEPTYQFQRRVFRETVLARDSETSIGLVDPSSTTPSGYQTPREIKEDQWKAEAQAMERPDKREMREMYKELGGRKARGKGRLPTGVGGGGNRDRGGWEAYEELP